MALTDAELDALRASMYQGLRDSRAKSGKELTALETLQHGTTEHRQASERFYSYCGEVEGWNRALLLLDQARRTAPGGVAR